jgi:hypothetical protein
MFDFNFDIYGMTVIIMLSIICWMLNIWRQEHNALMTIILDTLAEIKKKIG